MRITTVRGVRYSLDFLQALVLYRSLTGSVWVVQGRDLEAGNWPLAPRASREQSESYCAQHEDRKRDREWPGFDQERDEGGKGSRSGDGEDPRPDDTSSNAPAHGA